MNALGSSALTFLTRMQQYVLTRLASGVLDPCRWTATDGPLTCVAESVEHFLFDRAGSYPMREPPVAGAGHSPAPDGLAFARMFAQSSVSRCMVP